ncbi:MAG: caspase family protein [Sulfitobacter geojensis]
MKTQSAISGLFRTILWVALMVGISTAAHAGRVALVVGNAQYQNTQTLANPRNDAQAIASSLRALGFEVFDGYDLTRNAFEELIRDFARGAEGADAAVLYYAGHGLEVGSVNYLVPVDANIRDEADLKFETISLDDIIGFMEREQRTNLIFLDACRDNPMARNLSLNMGTRSVAVGRGLAPVDTGVGTLIAYATQPGNVALDGAGRHSPFTDALLEHISTPDLDVEIMMRSVRRDVMQKTAGQQVPWSSSSLTGSFIFQPKPVQTATPTAPPVAAPEPSTPERKTLPVLPLDDRKDQELTLNVQTQLNRLGCNAGTPDGIWGRKSHAALMRLVEHAPSIEIAAQEPSAVLLRQIAQLDGGICPLVCAPTQDLIDGACVRKTCASGQRLSSRGQCYTPQVAKPRNRTTSKSSSSCFKYNGQTFCD